MSSASTSKGRGPAPRAPVPARGRRRASPRVLIGAAVLIVLIAVAVALAFAFSGGSSTTTTTAPARGSLVNALPGAPEANRLLKGIPQEGNVLGQTAAPATLIEYVDLQCPYCQQFETQAMPTLIQRYVRTGKAKLEVRPVAFIGPDSQRGRNAAIAAGQQDKFFNFVHVLYLNQGPENTGWLGDDMITAIAASVPGMDVHRLLDDRNSAATKADADSFDRQAAEDQLQSTPKILVGKRGQTPQEVQLTSPTDVRSVAAALDRALG